MSHKHLSGIRKFNRTILNPVTRLFAGRFFYALVSHVGRSSGKPYTTPVVATAKDGCIFIPLPYGADTDWFLNVKAKGECVVKIKGKSFPAAHPVTVDASTALPAFSPLFQWAFRRLDVRQFLKLNIL